MSALEVELEFRSVPDNSWYNVLVRRQGEKLTVKYCNFPENQNEVFDASNFESLDDLKEFESRFRAVSVQLQDNQCHKAVEGSRVCASHAFSDVDNRFYDAVVEYVMHKRHSFTKEGEFCLCSFILLWQRGPLAGEMMEKKIENICLVQSDVELDQNVSSFLEIAKEKIGKKCAKRPVSQIHPSEGWIDNIHEDDDRQDTDFGGVDNYSILLENLEKDLSPSTITEFTHQQTSIVSKSYVFPSLPTELYARGVIVLNSQKDLLVLCEFLNSPDHIIISSRGRPWVVARDFLMNNMFVPTGTSILKTQMNCQLQKKLQKGDTGTCGDLKLAYSGTEEYEKAKKLRDLLTEFRLHHERLHKRLAIEEKKILQPSLAAL